MKKTIILNISNSKRFHYDIRNHIWIFLQLPFYNENGREIKFSDKNDNSKNFIFDTGAQNTIISYNRAKECGYLTLPVLDRVYAGGIGGGVVSCIRIMIPKITITQNLIVKEPLVLVTEDKNVNINILGQDILKPYSYYFDAINQVIFFDTGNL